MIHVLAFITAKPGQREAVLKEFRANMPAVHAEEGCIEYTPVTDLSGFGGAQAELGPDTFVVIEKWSTPETLRAHAAAAHMKDYGERTGAMVERRLIHVLSSAA
jgi:quinol monooxygenase YgiN